MAIPGSAFLELSALLGLHEALLLVGCCLYFCVGGMVRVVAELHGWPVVRSPLWAQGGCRGRVSNMVLPVRIVPPEQHRQLPQGPFLAQNQVTRGPLYKGCAAVIPGLLGNLRGTGD